MDATGLTGVSRGLPATYGIESRQMCDTHVKLVASRNPQGARESSDMTSKLYQTCEPTLADKILLQVISSNLS